MVSSLEPRPPSDEVGIMTLAVGVVLLSSFEWEKKSINICINKGGLKGCNGSGWVASVHTC